MALYVKPYQSWISQGIFSGFFILVAEIKGQIVGFCSLDGEGILSGLFILPKYSGQRIGSRLLSGVESVAKQKNIELISVSASLNARCFYEKLGYQYLYDTARSLDLGVVIKAVFMNKLLA